MNYLGLLLLGLLLLTCRAEAGMTGSQVAVGDAFVQSSADGQQWSIGTGAVSLTFTQAEGGLRLTSFRNLLTDPVTEYLDPATASAPFTLEGGKALGAFELQPLESHLLAPGETSDLGARAGAMTVKEGDLLGFAAVAHADDGYATLHWPVTVAYDDGETFNSTDDPQLPEGPIWHYFIQATGTGCLDPLGETMDGGPEGALRVPAGYRAPFECPRLGARTYVLLNAYTLLRVWQAPRDGRVTLTGPVSHTGGGVPVDVSLVRLMEKPGRTVSPASSWKLESGSARQVAAGGRPAVELELALRAGALSARLRIQAYPGTSVLRQSIELENTGSRKRPLDSPTLALLPLSLEPASSYTHYWLCGGTSRPNQGQLRQAEVSENYHQALLGEKSDNFVPWTALLRSDGPGDGLFAAVDYLGTWNLSLDRELAGPLQLGASLPLLATRSLAPGERFSLPLVTLGVFKGDLDDMGVRLYDWQYEYLWDFTNADYYAQTKWAVPWFFCSRNLQEQFAARLAQLDMDANRMRALGFEMLWDDAGWSKYPGWPGDTYATVFSPTNEGPDFAETLRYVAKLDMRWLAWFAGRPSAGIMDGKVGAWGNFQWRTDGVGRFGPEAEAAFLGQVEDFLTDHPRCSFHTCDGGSRFAHQFEVQRYADVNYLSDMGRGDETNYYFSYLELPDKWLDFLDPLLNPGTRFNPATSRRQLTMAPGWGIGAVEEDFEFLRQTNTLYRYLRDEGVVGRWSYTFHPKITGDEEWYYAQRTSHDRTKALIVLKHQPQGEVTIFPRGLLAKHKYLVGRDSTQEAILRTGADLMEQGITLKEPPAGELLYLGLPNRPGGGADKTAPTAPGRVLTRRETNLGHQGVGIYWSPGTDDNWVSGYEVRRGEQSLGLISAGTYTFDLGEGWDPAARYSVRTLDGDGNASEWTFREPLADAPFTVSALGGHYREAGREGWSAETSADGIQFSPMTFVPPARNPAGDLGGTPNQPGGVEGYWETGTARLGRGWQQAAADVQCVRCWTAARDGTVRVVGRAMKEAYHQDLGGPLQMRLLHNSEQVWPREGWATAPLNDLVGVTHDLTLAVQKGDKLRFVLTPSDQPDGALLAWMPIMTYVDEPALPVSGSVVRIACGAEASFTDSLGNSWEADRYFKGGKPLHTEAPIEGAQPTLADQALYQTGREGMDFTYVIPVESGLYTLRLKLAEPVFDWAFQRPFNLTINGQQVLTNFDVCQAARGPNKAYERVFNYLVPDAEGRLVLRFTSGSEPGQAPAPALVQAIEVLPALKPVVRIDCGADQPYVDWNSFIWSTDTGLGGGQRLTSEAPIAQASPTLYDQRLYQTASAGRKLEYVIQAPPGLYAVHLKFAELWLSEPGKRPLRIEVNGRVARDEWDPATAAGQVHMAADLRIEDVVPDQQGRITVRIVALGENIALLQAIEVE